MPMLALLLAAATPPFAAERAPVPPRAAAAQLQSAADQCKAATPDGDRCFAVQLALARALIDSDPAKAAEIAERARLDLLDTSDNLENALDSLRVKQTAGTLQPAEARQLAAGAEQVRRYWLDLADASETIGDAQRANDGLYRAVAQHYDSAAAVRAQHGRSDADRRARYRAIAKRIDAVAASPAVAEALPLARGSLAEAERAFGAADPVVVQLRLALADVLSGLGKADEAEPLYDRARAALASAQPGVRLDADARYARFLAAADRIEAAERVQREVVTRLLASEADKGRIARAYLDLAPLVGGSEGLALGRAALILSRERHGDTHIATARAKLALARMLNERAMPEEAEILLTAAVPVLQGMLTGSHPETAAAWLLFGENLLGQGKLDRADYAFERSGRGFADAYGERHPLVGRARMLRAAAMMRLGKSGWQDMLDQAVELIRAGRPATHLERVQAELALGSIQLLVLGDPRAALPQLRSVARAGLERTAAYRDFGTRAQAEIRQFSGVYGLQVRAAWQLAQPVR